MRGLLFTLAYLLGMTGCSTVTDFRRTQPVQIAVPDVISWLCPGPHRHRILGIMAFDVPLGFEPAGVRLAKIYRDVLVREQTFHQVVLWPAEAPKVWSDVREAAATRRFDLLLVGHVRKLDVGSGAITTRINLEVQVLDVQTGKRLWDVYQEAVSWPQPDVDLFWHVATGGRAGDYEKLAWALADQFAELLSPKEAAQRGCVEPMH